MKKLHAIALPLFSIAVLGFAQDAVKQPRLDRYIGNWEGYSSMSTSISGSIDISSKWMKTSVKRASPEAIELAGNQWGVKAACRYDKATAQHLLSWNADGFPPVVDLPLQPTGPDGFSGTATFTYKGKECTAKATLQEKKEGGSAWELVITQGRDKWNLTLGLGKPE